VASGLSTPRHNDEASSVWLVYIVECADGSFYTGITNDFERRLLAHNTGMGARYTRGRSPVRPVFIETCEDKSAALKRELAIKRLSRLAKRALIAHKLF
jgi:predicted GIY-YIG superfamily endonuclease